MPRPHSVLGADGCRGGGWVVAVVDPGGALSWAWADDATALLALADELDAAAAALDVPIGLPALGGRRRCDDLARARLGPRRSSVFAAPPREVLACPTYADARLVVPSLSAQAFALVPRVRDVDAALRARGPAVHATVVECHPEVVFAMLAADPVPAKKTAAGVLARITLLQAAFAEDLPPDVPPAAALDDALDAAACAWTALRWSRGNAKVLGGDLDAHALPMRIVV